MNKFKVGDKTKTIKMLKGGFSSDPSNILSEDTLVEIDKVISNSSNVGDIAVYRVIALESDQIGVAWVISEDRLGDVIE